MRIPASQNIVVLCLAVLCVAPAPLLALDTGHTVDMAIDASGPTSVDRGQPFTLTAFVQNKGSVAAHETVITLPLQAGLSLQTAGSDAGCKESGMAVQCHLGTVEVNQMRVVSIVLRTAYQDSCSVIQYLFQPTVSTVESDAFPATNTSKPLSTTVACVARPPQCSDGLDNDRDGRIDADDPDCTSPSDDNEATHARNVRSPVLPWRVQSSSSSSSSSRSVVSSLPSSSSLPAAQVSLLLRPDQDSVAPGQSVGISVYVRNLSQQPITALPVRASFDGSRARATSDTGFISGDTVSWSVDVASGGTRLLRLVLRPEESAAGMSLVLSVSASAPGGYRTSGLAIPVLAALPQTGAGEFAGPLGASRFLTPTAASSTLSLLLVTLAGITLSSAGTLAVRRVRGR